MKIKICGMTSFSDIEAANAVLPDYIGFILAPGRRRTVSYALAAQMKRALSPAIQAVGVFVDPTLSEVLEPARNGTIDLIQLHGVETPEFVRTVKKATGLPVVKALILKPGVNPPPLSCWEASDADYLLLDAGTGSGVALDWNTLPQVKKPFFLAGGITPENIREAIKRVQPYAIDCSSGAEENGIKNLTKMKALTDAVKTWI